MLIKIMRNIKQKHTTFLKKKIPNKSYKINNSWHCKLTSYIEQFKYSIYKSNIKILNINSIKHKIIKNCGEYIIVLNIFITWIYNDTKHFILWDIKYSNMSQKDDELLKLTSYVEISKYREKTLKSIGNNVKIPTNIAKDSGIRTNHISKVLSELKNKEIVECINEEARKGRLYRLTDTGKEVLESINEKEEEDNEN